MTSLDTNVVLRLLLGDVPHQTAKGVALLRKTKCYLTDAVAVEVIYVLEKVYKNPRSHIVSLVRKLLMIDNLSCTEFVLTEVLELYQRQPALSIIDCYASVEAAKTDNSFATFDKKLVKYGGTHVVVL
ncbi:MAG: PIN domain-containing protein [Pyrinomonadaceae bacterium]|nr:PIN domain-containing protein [Pyrinomonadaceae bacterium]